MHLKQFSCKNELNGSSNHFLYAGMYILYRVSERVKSACIIMGQLWQKFIYTMHSDQNLLNNFSQFFLKPLRKKSYSSNNKIVNNGTRIEFH